jgi:hypothetical protein
MLVITCILYTRSRETDPQHQLKITVYKYNEGRNKSITSTTTHTINKHKTNKQTNKQKTPHQKTPNKLKINKIK